MSEIMDLTVVCNSFPPSLAGREIIREGSLDTIEQMVKNGIELIIVEGQEGIGKSVLLTQFVKKHPDDALSLWVKPTHRSIDILRADLCNQIAWALNKQELDQLESTDYLLQTYVAQLARKARAKKYFFILDGLQEIPTEEAEVKRILIDMLPWGYRGFHFIISGDSEDITRLIPSKINFKTLPLPRFRLDQTKKYFSDLHERQITEEQVYDLHEVCQRLPYRLASTKRLLEGGTQPDELHSKSDLYQLEWERVENSPNRYLLEKLLAVISYGYSTYSITDIANILDERVADLEKLLSSIDFVRLDEKSSCLIFPSESFRRFAADKLAPHKKEVQDSLIDYLYKEPDNEITMQQLPLILVQAGRQRELLNYLSSERFLRRLEKSQSLFTLQHEASLGLLAARDLRADDALVRFMMHKSTLIGLNHTDIWRSEIEARTAIKDYESALLLAQSAVLKVDRLRLLSIIARLQQEENKAPAQYILDQIRHLYSQLELNDYGDKAIEIAGDLIFVDPELAIDLVEKSTQTDVGENSLDLALVKLYGNALFSEEAGNLHSSDSLEKIRSHINNPTLQHLTTATTILVGDYSAPKVIQEVEKISKTSDRVFLLRLWLTNNREREDAIDVIEYAINLIIRETSYSPNARVLREIASPLPYVHDTEKLKKLVNTFNSQAEGAKAIGPTQDYIRLQLILAVAESRYSLKTAIDRVLEIYLYDIESIEDLAVKTESLARLVTMISELQVGEDFKEDYQDINDNLEKSFEALLADSADHYRVSQGTIKALAKVFPSRALDYACRLNTEERRNWSIFHLIESVIQLPTLKIDLSFVNNAIEKITNPQIRDRALLATILELEAAKNDFKAINTNALQLIAQIDNMQAAVQKCNAYCLAYNYLMCVEPDKYSRLANTILSKLKTSWDAIDIGWNKIDAGFGIVATISENFREQVRNYLTDTETFRQTLLIESLSNADTYLLCLQLTVKAFSGLIPRSIDATEDLDRLGRFIDFLPANGIKARVWSDIALLFYLQNREESFKNLVKQHTLPLLDSINELDVIQVEEATVAVAPALYYYHKKTALERITRLPNPARLKAYGNICEFILRKRILTEPYRVQPGQEYSLSYEDLVDVCEILENVEKDEILAKYIMRAAESTYRSRSKHILTRQQEPDILNRFRNIVNDLNKLPDKRNINHEGYKIVCLAQLALLDRNFKPENWQDLASAARNIPNLSDRVYVLSFLASVLPIKRSSLKNLKEILFQEAYEQLEKIPTLVDKINRLEGIAIQAQRANPSLSRKCLEKGLQLLVKEDDDLSTFSEQRKFIDLAHLLVDEEFAASLASMVDDDPAREKIRHNLQEQHQINQVQRNIANSRGQPQDCEEFKKIYPRAAWKLWEAINIGQASPIGQEYCRLLMGIAAEMPLEEAFPIIGVVIESVNMRYANIQMEQARKNLRPIFEAMLHATELAGRIVIRSTEQLDRVKAHRLMQVSHSPTTIIVRPGDMEHVEKILRDWFENDVGTYLKICDQYFGPNELKILLSLRATKPDCNVMILTSATHQKNGQIEKPWRETYQRYWHDEVSSIQDPPSTKIVIVGNADGYSPIHDRWWLTNTGGIKIGTSLNSLGVTQISEIEFMNSEQAAQKEYIVDRYLLQFETSDEKGQKLQYEMFTL